MARRVQERAAAPHLWPALATILVASWCLAASHAFIRPLFQVSDELNYLHTVQVTARQQSPADAPCIAPPAGATFDYPAGGGKAGFHHVASRVLVSACRMGAGRSAIPVTRALLALTFPLFVGFTWALARLVIPGAPVIALTAATFTSAQPVMATFFGGITPDGLANAAAALALVIATHLVLNRAHVLWITPLSAAAIAGAASKDSTLFLGPLIALVALAWGIASTWAMRLWALAMLTGAGAIIVGAGWLSRLRTPFPNLDVVAASAVSHPVDFLVDVIRSYGTHSRGLIESGLGGLSNFGGGTLLLIAPLLWLQVAVAVIGVIGFLLRLAAHGEKRLIRFALLACAALALAAVQIPVRQLMTNSAGPMQGRWLFPVWPLMAVSAAIGWDHLVRGRSHRILPLLSVLGAVTAIVSLVQVVAYYYAEWPSTYAWSRVFLLASEGYDLGPLPARAMAAAVGVPPTWRIAVGLAAVASLTAVQAASFYVAMPPGHRRTSR